MKHPTKRRRGGVVLVEAALVLAVFLVIVLGMLDFGLAVLRRNALSEAARRLARQAIVHGETAAPETTPWGPAAFGGTAADGGAIAAAARPALVAMNPSEVGIQVEWLNGGNRIDDRVQVTVNYQHHSVVPLMFGGGALDLTAVSLMRIVH